MKHDISWRVLFEDNHIIVVNKPSGMLTQGDISGEESLLDLLKEYVKVKYSKPGEAFIGLVHRLDRPVSGLLVFARTSKAASRLHAEITSGRMDKFYIALTGGRTGRGPGWHSLENHLRRDRDITVICGRNDRDAQRALLYYTELDTPGKNGLLLIKLETGRKHQIRAQLSAAGHAVLGDRKYGSFTGMGNGICLHSVYLAFTHPVKKELMEFYSPPPDEFMQRAGLSEAGMKALVMEKISSFRDQIFLSKTDPL